LFLHYFQQRTPLSWEKVLIILSSVFERGHQRGGGVIFPLDLKKCLCFGVSYFSYGNSLLSLGKFTKRIETNHHPHLPHFPGLVPLANPHDL